MPYIETLPEVLVSLADRFKLVNNPDSEGCAPTCNCNSCMVCECRRCFLTRTEARIRRSIDNEEKLSRANLK